MTLVETQYMADSSDLNLPSLSNNDITEVIRRLLDEQGLFGDGKTYGRELGRISPELNLYGQTRTVREVDSFYWWAGDGYACLETSGEVNNITELPQGPRPRREVWRVPTGDKSPDPRKAYKFYFWNDQTEQWQEIKWRHDVEAYKELPVPGLGLGIGHRVVETDVTVIWDGYTWRRHPKHSSLEDDEPERHLPPGFFDLLVDDATLMMVSRKEIAIRATKPNVEAIFVCGDRVPIDEKASVFSSSPALEYLSGTLSTIPLKPNFEYLIYLANTKCEAFKVGKHDFRGKLFLVEATGSFGQPINIPEGRYWGTDEVRKNALFAGRVETDNTPSSSGGPYFKPVVNLNALTKSASLYGVFQDVCDFYIDYIDHETLRLEKLHGFRGQMYIPLNIQYIGEGYDIKYNSPIIKINENTWLPEKVDYGDIETKGTRLYIYIANLVDAFNFNPINDETGRPWREEDANSDGNYDPALDFRLKPFLSPQPPNEFFDEVSQLGIYRMGDVSPICYTRLLGKVDTDNKGYFIYDPGISVIRAREVPPTNIRAYAEITLFVEEGNIKMRAADGSDGFLQIAGDPFHIGKDILVAKYSDPVYTYSSESPYLTQVGKAEDFKRQPIQLYICTKDPFWGDKAHKLVWFTNEPILGYLDVNWPGNNARWIATIELNEAGRAYIGCVKATIGDQFNSVVSLQELVQSLSSHDNTLDNILGWQAGFDETFSLYVSNLSQDISSAFSAYSGLSGVTDSLSAHTNSLFTEVSYLSNYTRSLSLDITSAIDEVNLLSNTTDGLSVNIQSLGNSISTHSSLILSLSSDIGLIGGDIASLYGFVSLFDNNTMSAVSNISTIQSTVQEIETSLSGVLSQYSQVSGIWGDLTNLTNSLSTDYSSILSLYGLLSVNLDTIYLDQQYMLNLNVALEANQSALQDDYVSLSLLQSAMGDNIHTMSADITSLYGYANVISLITDEILIDISALYSDYSSLSIWIGSLGNTLVGLSGHYNSLMGDLTALSLSTSADFGNVWNDISLIWGDIANISGDYRVLSQITDHLSFDVNSLSGHTLSLSNAISGLNVAIGNVEQDYAAQSLLIDSLSILVSNLGVDIQTHSGLISSLQATAQDLRGQISLESLYLVSLSGKINSLSLDVSGIDRDVDSLSANISSIGGQLAGLSGWVNSLDGATKTLSGNVNNYYSLTTNLSNQLNTLSHDTSLFSQNFLSLSQNFNNIQSGYSSISGYVNSYSVQLAQFSGTLSRISGDYANISGTVVSVDSLARQVSSDAVSLSNNLTLLSGRLSGISGTVGDIQSYINALNQNLNGEGYAGNAPQLVTYDWIGRRFLWENEKGIGLQCKIIPSNNYTIRLVPTSADAQMVTQNLGLLNVDTEGYMVLALKGVQDLVVYNFYIRLEKDFVGSCSTVKGEPIDISIVARGNGYRQGQILTLVQGDNTSASVRIDRTDAPVIQASIVNSGTGYTANDTLTLVQSGASGCQVRVTAVDTGITSVSIVDALDVDPPYRVGELCDVPGGTNGVVQVTEVYHYGWVITGINTQGHNIPVGADLYVYPTVVATMTSSGLSYNGNMVGGYVYIGMVVAYQDGFGNQYDAGVISSMVDCGAPKTITIYSRGYNYSSANNITVNGRLGGRWLLISIYVTKAIIASSLITGGTSYLDGSVVPTTGGTGSGATFSITNGVGGITSVSIVSGGDGYTKGNYNTSGGTGAGAVINCSKTSIGATHYYASQEEPTKIYTAIKTRDTQGGQYHDSIYMGRIIGKDGIYYNYIQLNGPLPRFSPSDLPVCYWINAHIDYYNYNTTVVAQTTQAADVRILSAQGTLHAWSPPLWPCPQLGNNPYKYAQCNVPLQWTGSYWEAWYLIGYNDGSYCGQYPPNTCYQTYYFQAFPAFNATTSSSGVDYRPTVTGNMSSPNGDLVLLIGIF